MVRQVGAGVMLGDLADGYYWARHQDGTTFVVFLEDGQWWTVVIENPIDFDRSQIIMPVPRPDH